MNKIRDNRGETLVESLVSLLIIMFAMLFLTGSVVAAARANAKMQNTDNSLHYGTIDETSAVSEVLISSDPYSTDDDINIEVTAFEQNGYKHYS